MANADAFRDQDPLQIQFKKRMNKALSEFIRDLTAHWVKKTVLEVEQCRYKATNGQLLLRLTLSQQLEPRLQQKFETEPVIKKVKFGQRDHLIFFESSEEASILCLKKTNLHAAIFCVMLQNPHYHSKDMDKEEVWFLEAELETELEKIIASCGALALAGPLWDAAVQHWIPWRSSSCSTSSICSGHTLWKYHAC